MRPTRLETSFLLSALLIISAQLFVPPLVGMADSWDFERVLSQSGLAHVATTYEDKYFLRVDPTYQLVEPSRLDDPTGLYTYHTSTLLVVRMARSVAWLAGQERLDIRTMGAIYVAVYLIGLWLLLAAGRSLSRPLRLLLAAMLLVVFTDVGYVAYFNSFYSEGTALCLLLVGIGCWLLAASKATGRVGLPIVASLALAVVVASKPAYAPLAALFTLFGTVLSMALLVGWRRWLSVTLALASSLVGCWYSIRTPSSMAVHSAYIGIFMDLMPHSGTRQADLVALGLKPDYAALTGTTPYQPDSPLNDPAFRSDFVARVDSWTLPAFYVTHPRRFHELLVRSAKRAFETRVRRLGYYTKESGMPARAQAFGVWSAVRETAVPRIVPLLGLFVATGALATVQWWRARRYRHLYLLYATLVAIAAAQFLLAVLFGGGVPDLEKHLFMFNLAFDGCVILLALAAGAVMDRRWRRGAGIEPAGAEPLNPERRLPERPGETPR